MRITVTLSQADVIDMIRAGLKRRNLLASPDDGDFNLIVEDDSTFKLELQNVEVGEPIGAAPSVPHYTGTGAPPPAPPTPIPATGDDTGEFDEEALNSVLAQNKTLSAVPPTKGGKYVPPRERFKTTKTADSIEGLGKDPTDWHDEV